jgi:hypothetical protein
MALLIIFILICICAAIGKGWAVADPNPIIDHEAASAHVQGEDD